MTHFCFVDMIPLLGANKCHDGKDGRDGRDGERLFMYFAVSAILTYLA